MFLSKKNNAFTQKFSSSLLLFTISLFASFLIGQTPFTANIIGLASNFGPWGDGTVFSMQNDGSNFQVVRPLGAGRGLDGSNPVGTMIEGPGGFLYGMTYQGGVNGHGTIFRVTSTGTGFSVIRHLLDTADGSFPHGGLYLGLDGALYGVTSDGGQYRGGTLFKIEGDGSGFQVLHHFNAPIEGGFPWGALIQLSDSFLYGLTYREGLYMGGSFYRIKPDGSSFQVLHQFNPTTDGSLPHGSLILLPNGKLAGMTHRGGTFDDGTIFSINPGGLGFSVLHHLDESSDGSRPIGKLTLANDGYLYGLTQFGGSTAKGTCFRIMPDGSGFGVVYEFDGMNGERPQASLSLGGDGLLYGTASLGGNFNSGVIFSINPADSSYSVLHHLFATTDGGTPTSDILILPATNLPVAWATFDVQPAASVGARLQWQTSYEQGNRGFYIQRSIDGQVFETLGWEPSAGDHEIEARYSFTDVSANEGTWYYRLRQVDIDGAFSFSSIQSVTLTSDFRLAVFPNPTNGILNIQSGILESSNVRLEVFNFRGGLVLGKMLNDGALTHMLDVQSLRSGMYVLRLRDERGEYVQERFLVE